MRFAKQATLAFLLTSGALFADGIDWFAVSGGIVDSGGSPVSNTSQWWIQMYQSTDATIEFSNGAPTDDDVILASVFHHLNDLGGGTDGEFFTQFDPTTTGGPVDGANVYSVIFNATNIAEATMYAVIDNAVAVVQDSSIPAPNWSYDVGTTVAGDWQPIVIPEPASLALLGLGLVAARLRKKTIA